MEHLTTFHFGEKSRLEAHIAENSTSVVALSGPGQVCVVLSKCQYCFTSIKHNMRYYLTMCDWCMDDYFYS